MRGGGTRVRALAIAAVRVIEVSVFSGNLDANCDPSRGARVIDRGIDQRARFRYRATLIAASRPRATVSDFQRDRCSPLLNFPKLDRAFLTLETHETNVFSLPLSLSFSFSLSLSLSLSISVY